MNPDNKRHFKLLVVANNIRWPSLMSQLYEVRDFYKSVCILDIIVIHTSYTPIYKALEGQNGLCVVDPEWYETNITIPNALEYDLNMFITPLSQNPPTFGGYMNPVNIGPWETTVFAGAETDHSFFQGKDMGSAFILTACHELSHAFYYMLGKRDMTHTYFPVNQNPYTTVPQMVLADFDFESLGGVLAWCKERLLSALLALNFIEKKRPFFTVDEKK